MKLLPWAEIQKNQGQDIYQTSKRKGHANVGPGDYKSSIEIEQAREQKKLLKLR
jgi:hypothetical protein